MPRVLALGAGGALLLLNSLAIFLQHHAYPLASAEVGWVALGVVGFGFALGALAGLAGRWGGALALGALVVVVADLQVEGAVSRWFVGGVWLASAALAFVVHARLPRLLPGVGGFLLVTTLVFGGEGRYEAWSDATPVGKSELPPVVHLILDGHTGFEGIPAELDAETRVYERMRRFYGDHGFVAFGKAYSRYHSTSDSISNALNFVARDDNHAFFKGKFKPGKDLSENAYLDLMAARGYRLEVLQTDYLDLCGAHGASKVAACDTYVLEAVGAIRDATLGAKEKAQVIGGGFVRLSTVLTALRKETPLFGFLGKSSDRLSSLSAMPILEALPAQVAEMPAGTLRLFHILLPHYPFAYDAECRLRESPEAWLNAYDEALRPAKNDAASRELRWHAYLEQMHCLYSRLEGVVQAAEKRGAVVILHGDHGSRIVGWAARAENQKRLSPQDYIDSFSTLFAVRLPKPTPRYEVGPAPLEALVKWTADSLAAPESELPVPVEASPTVFLDVGGKKRMPAKPLPDFERGQPRTAESPPLASP